MSPPVADKAPEILRSEAYLNVRCNDEGRGESACGGQMDVFQQPFLKKEVNLF